MHGVVFEIEIKINTPALDFPLIGVLTKHSSRRISVCLAPLNGGYKIHLTQTMAPDTKDSHLA